MINQISVVIADDHHLYRRGLVGLLKTEGIEVRSEASNATELIKQVNEYNPDVVITDLIMPGDGIKAIKEMVSNGISRIIALSSFESEGLMTEAKEAGAIGFIQKNTENEEIIKAIKIVYNYQEYYCTSIALKIVMRLEKIDNKKMSSVALPSFSAEEIDIIRLLCDGKTGKDIAKELYIGKRTFDRIKKTIFEKMHIKTTAQMAIYAVKHSLIIQDDSEQDDSE